MPVLDLWRFVTDELGFDACVNYKSPTFRDDLAAACPRGIDVYFENVGGAVFAAVLKLINQNARNPLCGLIADYNATEPRPAPNLRPLLVKRALIKGFIISDHPGRAGDFQRDASGWVKAGQIKYREDIVDGLDHAPAAFLKLFEGANFGKLLVRVSPDPTRRAG